MNTQINTPRPPGPADHQGHAGSLASKGTIWLLAIAGLLVSSFALLFLAVGPAPLPDRFIEALVFLGVLMLVEAVLQSRGSRDVALLLCAATAVMVLWLWFAPIWAMVVCVVSLAAWWRSLFAHEARGNSAEFSF